jgi:hypothetical protein
VRENRKSSVRQCHAIKKPVEDPIVIESLIDARKARRKIIELVTKQQLEDSYCAEKLKQVGLDGKRKLLELLAAWLVSFEPDKQFSDTDRGVFAAIGTQVNLGSWLSLQQHEAALNQKMTEARHVEEALRQVYDRVAPKGVLSIWLNDGAEKAKAERLREEYKAAKKSRKRIEQESSVAREDIRKAIGSFLRDAINPKSLDLLSKEASIKGELASLIQKLEENAGSVWGPHAQKQQSLLGEIANETTRLSDVFSSANARVGK